MTRIRAALMWLWFSWLLLVGLMVNAYLTAHAVCTDCHTLIEQANQGAHWLTLTGFLFFSLALALVPRRRVLLAWLAPGMVAFFWWYGYNLLPKPEPDIQGDVISVATYNVLGHLADPERTFAVIQEMDVDIVGLQELRPILEGKLQAELADEYPYQVSKVVQGFEGLAIISRYPIVESQIVLDDDLENIDLRKLRYVRAVIDVNGRRIVVYSFHAVMPFFKGDVPYSEAENRAQIQQMVERISAEELPVLLGCDCNMGAGARTRQYGWLDAVLDDAFAHQGWGLGLTHPQGYDLPYIPAVRIDYVWYSDAFTPLEAKVWDDSGTSDHHPMWTRLVLRAE